MEDIERVASPSCKGSINQSRELKEDSKVNRQSLFSVSGEEFEICSSFKKDNNNILEQDREREGEGIGKVVVAKQNKLIQSQRSLQIMLAKSLHQNGNQTEHLQQEQLIDRFSTAKRLVGIRSRMAPSVRLIERGQSKPLRRINIIGQLNHSTSKGFLFVALNLLISLALLQLVVPLIGNKQLAGANASVWPFTKPASSGNNHHHHHHHHQLSPSGGSWRWSSGGSANNTSNTSLASNEARSKRVARDSSKRALASNSQNNLPVPAPISQQMHYFWNHDQIEPKVMADEAQKILAEAQLQTDLKAIGEPHSSAPIPIGSAKAQQVSSISRQDLASSASSPASSMALAGQDQQSAVMIPQAIQQQLTAMVLQMQRQQQLSMMMQPRFDAASRRSLMSHAAANPALARSFWMAGSSQHPAIVAPPALLPQMFAAESIQQQQQQQQVAANLMAPNRLALSSPAMATMAGVPVYGPFMVAPSVAQSPLSPVHFPTNHLAGQRATNSAPASQRESNPGTRQSLLGRRKSWPLFGFGSGGDTHRAHSNSDLLIAGSHLKPSSVSASQQAPPAAAAHGHAPVPKMTFSLPPESLALIDLASNQLFNTIAGQVQARVMQQKFAAALAQLIEPQVQQPSDMIQTSASLPSMSVVKPAEQQQQQMFGQRPIVNLQPPYLVNAINSAASQMPANEFAHQSALNTLLSVYQQPSQIFELANMLSNFSSPNSSPSYGSRLKRRHLNTMPPQRSSPKGASSPEGARFGHQSARVAANQAAAEDQLSARLMALEQEPIDHFYQDAIYSFHSANETKFDRPAQAKSSAAHKIGPKPDNWSQQQPVSVARRSLPRQPTNLEAFPAARKSSRRDPVEGQMLTSEQQQFATARKRANDQRSSSKSGDHLRQLFMILTTESPLSGSSSQLEAAGRNSSNLFDLEEQTQLRRLKRSISMDEDEDTSLIGKSGDISSRSRRKSRSIEQTTNANSWRSSSKSSGFVPMIVADEQQVAISPMESANKQPAMDIKKAQLNEELDGRNWQGNGMVDLKWAKFGPSSSASTKSSSLGGAKSSPAWISMLDERRGKSFEFQDKSRADAVILRRQAEIDHLSGPSSKQNSSTISSSSSSSSSSMTTTIITSKGNEQIESEKASPIKVKRITASASVLHHPKVSVKAPSSSEQVRQGIVLSGVAIPLRASQVSQSSPSAQPPQSGPGSSIGKARAEVSADPMMSSLSESTRVVNYFQNVENERAPAEAPQQQEQPINNGQSAGSQQQQSAKNGPIQEVPVGFSQPAKLHSQQSSGAIRRLEQADQQQQQQVKRYPGNEPSSPSRSANDFGSPSATVVQQSQSARPILSAEQLNRHRQSMAAVSNADISSAATAGNLAYANSLGNLGGQQGQVSMRGQQQGFVGAPGQLASGSGQQPIGGGARGGMLANLRPAHQKTTSSEQHQSSSATSSGASIGEQLKAGYLGGLASAQSRSSSSNPIFGATSHNRQSVVAPGSKAPESGTNENGHSTSDRSVSADQSNSYNEELIPPPMPSQASSSSFANGGNNSGMFSSNLIAPVDGQQLQQQQQQLDQMGASQGFDSSSPSSMADQQNLDQSNLMNYANEQGQFGSRNPSNEQPMDANQQMEFNRFNQQQQQQQPSMSASQAALFGSNSGQSESSDAPDSLYGSTGSFGQSGSYAQQQQQQQQFDSENQSMTAQSNQAPILPQHQQQQYYSQQLQALGAVVSNLNQQRFNQQLQEAAMRSSLSPTSSSPRDLMHAQSNSQHPSSPFLAEAAQQLQQQNLYGANPSSSYSQHLQQANLYSPSDEEAAAGAAAAAAGVPTYPSAAQLMAIQSHGDQLNDANHRDLMMPGSEQRREQDDESGGSKKGGKIKNKSGGFKQVSHHYHFNSLGSPFEDPESHLSPANPFELASAVQNIDGVQGQIRHKPKGNKDEDKEKQQEEEEEKKPKKKGFLRRFSLKEFFKKFRKGKKKENEQVSDDNNNNSNNNNNSSSNNNESGGDR